jgi:uncharacterized protein (TIGR00369 family)
MTAFIVETPNWLRDLRNIADAPGPAFRRGWDGLSRLPGGKRIFSQLAGKLAPFSGAVHPQVLELGKGYGRVRMPYHRRVLNHIGCVHAAAFFDLAEFTAIITLGYNIPDGARLIVSGAQIRYLKKGRSDVLAICECPPIESAERREFELPVRMENKDGELLAELKLNVVVGPAKGAA